MKQIYTIFLVVVILVTLFGCISKSAKNANELADHAFDKLLDYVGKTEQHELNIEDVQWLCATVSMPAGPFREELLEYTSCEYYVSYVYDKDRYAIVYVNHSHYDNQLSINIEEFDTHQLMMEQKEILLVTYDGYNEENRMTPKLEHIGEGSFSSDEIDKFLNNSKSRLE